jgi:phage N-6-adenine-methyltransferase
VSGASVGGGRTKQDYGTPWEFIRAVEARFGPMVFDLAASPENAKASLYFTEQCDAFAQDWRGSSVIRHGNRWLNPPFANIQPWARHARAAASHDARIFMLTPASIGANWFAEHVFGRALVLGVRPRLTFDGEKDTYPKDLMLSIFGEFPGFGVWRWKS